MSRLKTNLVIAQIYKATDTRPQKCIEQIRNVEFWIDQLGNPAPNSIILGDFNLPHLRRKWPGNNVVPENLTRFSSYEQLNKRELCRLCDKFSISQQIAKLTGKKSCTGFAFHK